MLHEVNLFECFLILDFTWCAFLFTAAACLLWNTLPYLWVFFVTTLTNALPAFLSGLSNFYIALDQLTIKWSGTFGDIKSFFTRYLLPIILDYILFCIDDYLLTHTTLSFDMLHDPNNSYFLHISCLNSDLTTAYRHFFISTLECALKCKPLLRVSFDKFWIMRSRDRSRPRYETSVSSDDSTFCSYSRSSPPRSDSFRDSACVKTNADASIKVKLTDTFQTSPSPCHFASGSYFSTSSFSQSSPQLLSCANGTGNEQGDNNHSSANDGSSQGNSKTSNSGTTSPTSAGSNSKNSNNNGNDDDDDDDGYNDRLNTECLKSYVVIGDEDKDEESVTEHEDDSENNPTSLDASSLPEMKTPALNPSPLLHLNLESPVSSTTNQWSPILKNTPTEEMLKACEELSNVQKLKSLPTIPGINDPDLRYKNLSAVSGYISIDNGNSTATPHRDILHDKALVPGKAADILKDQIGSNVPFDKKNCGGQQRDLVMFSSRYFQIDNWNCYNLSESEDIPLMLQGFNQIIKDHHIDEDPLLNSCMIERLWHKDYIPERSLIPDDIQKHIHHNSSMIVVCLGDQNDMDMIPKTDEGSTLGKVDAGRIYPGSGSGILLSKNTLDRFHVRTLPGFGSCRDENDVSLRLTFFRNNLLEETLLWDNGDLCTDNESPSSTHTPRPPVNLLGFRMGQVLTYKTVLQNKCKTKILRKILKALNETTSSVDSDEDMRTRILTLLSDQHSVIPRTAIELLVSKMVGDQVRTELLAFGLKSQAHVGPCKERLVEFLSSSNQPDPDCDVFSFSPPEAPSQHEHSLSSNDSKSPKTNEFHFSGNLPCANDFLKTPNTTKAPALAKKELKRKRSQVITGAKKDSFTGLDIYLKSLANASESELTRELEYLQLSTTGSVALKRKRISQHLTNPNSHANESMVSANNRLEILEKCSITTRDMLDEVRKDLSNLVLRLGNSEENSEPACKKHCADTNQNASLLPALTKNLVKAQQDTQLLLERSERGNKELTDSLRNIMTLKKDLETWHESVFKSQDSDRIEKILEMLSEQSQSTQERGRKRQNRSSSAAVNDDRRPTAKSPSDTKTNKDTPGLPYREEGRQTYRRRSVTPKPRAKRGSSNTGRRKNSGKKSRTTTNHQKKVVLLTDGTMRGFRSEEFSRSYNVTVIHKPSLAQLEATIASTAQDISNINPEAVYMHTGTTDIDSGQLPSQVADSLINCTEKILRETSQNCKVIISHPIPRGKQEKEFNELQKSLSLTMTRLKSDPGKSDFWKRSSENRNTNFYETGSASPHKYLVTDDRAHLNGRGIRVIMGNFRSALNSTFRTVRQN